MADHTRNLQLHSETAPDDRSTREAMLRGWRRRCPNCGAGPMMRGYLTVRDNCEVCNEALHHHRADDGPAWVVMLVCGHILAPLMLLVFELWRPQPLILGVGFSVAFVALALWMLPRVKGTIVAIQWSKRMHGFGKEAKARSPAE
ncbi:MAG: DUF983 domain-containing protein [Pseudomonadota bacterium]